MSAGRTTTAQPRSRVSYNRRATAVTITSISVPENVIQWDNVPVGREPRVSKLRMLYCTMPTSALAAPAVRTIVRSVRARAPRAKSYTIGISRKSDSCLQSSTLAAGSCEKPAASSVSAA